MKTAERPASKSGRTAGTWRRITPTARWPSIGSVSTRTPSRSTRTVEWPRNVSRSPTLHPPTSKLPTGRENGPSIVSAQNGGRTRRPGVGSASDAPPLLCHEYRQNSPGEADEQQGQERQSRVGARNIANGAGGRRCHARRDRRGRCGRRGCAGVAVGVTATALLVMLAEQIM